MRIALLVVVLAGCDFHERYAPTTPRGVATQDAVVTLHELGYDGSSLSVAVDVTNRSDHRVRFDPAGAQLALGSQRLPSVSQPVVDGAPIVAGAVAGAAHGAHGVAAGIVGGAADAVLLAGINELVRGPYTHFAHELAPGERSRFTLQFPLVLRGENICALAQDGTADCSQPSSVRDNLSVELGGVGTLPLFDPVDPHLGVGPPSSIGGVYEFRIGGGPGMGRAPGAGGIELAAGPRWGRFALVGTAQLGLGFPLGVETQWHVVDRGAVHVSTTVGGAYWFYPEGHALGPRAGVELGLDFAGRQLTWPSHALQLGFYARGGPVFFRRDGATGGELEFGLAMGFF
jgi:hypothetical protein